MYCFQTAQYIIKLLDNYQIISIIIVTVINLSITNNFDKLIKL